MTSAYGADRAETVAAKKGADTGDEEKRPEHDAHTLVTLACGALAVVSTRESWVDMIESCRSLSRARFGNATSGMKPVTEAFDMIAAEFVENHRSLAVDDLFDVIAVRDAIARLAADEGVPADSIECFVRLTKDLDAK